MTLSLADAARERAQHIRARADRPSQRRCASAPGSGARAIVRASIQLREDAPPAGEDGQVAESAPAMLRFSGIASAYEASYEMWDAFGPYTEVVSAGAGAVSMARSDLDVPFVLGHDQLRRIARTTTGTLRLSETEDGLVVDADLDPRDADVAYIAPKLRAGLIDEMSFAFRITSGQWSPDYSEYRINAFDIHRGDVAIVGYGANPATSAGVRSQRNGNARARALLALAIAR